MATNFVTQPNLTIERLTEYYSRIRKALPFCAASIAIAGGAVRDVICGKRIKDIDLFIEVWDWKDDPVRAVKEIDAVTDALNKLFYEFGKVKSITEVLDQDAESYKNSCAKIAEVWGWPHGFHDMSWDVVFVSCDVTDYITESFDLGLCQAWIGFYGLKTTRQFWKDYHNKTITYLREQGSTPEQLKASQVRVRRLLEKYEGWKTRNITPADPVTL